MCVWPRQAPVGLALPRMPRVSVCSMQRTCDHSSLNRALSFLTPCRERRRLGAHQLNQFTCLRTRALRWGLREPCLA